MKLVSLLSSNLIFFIFLSSVTFVDVAHAEDNPPHSVPAALVILRQFIDAKRDVGNMIRTVLDDFGITNSKRRYAYTDYLDLSQAFDPLVASHMIRFTLKSSRQPNQHDFTGRGKMQVEIYPNEGVMLIIGKEGMPSMKADLNGNKLLTAELRERLQGTLDRLHKDVSLVVAADDSAVQEASNKEFQRFSEVEQALQQNETLLPDEASDFLKLIYETPRQSNVKQNDPIVEIINVNLQKQ